MKNKYIPPKSRLFVLNLNENIAVSGGLSEVSGAAVIKFTHAIDGCRNYYSGNNLAVVSVPTNATFQDYYQEMKSYGAMVYFECFSYKY